MEQLGDAHDGAVWDVTNVHLAHKRHQMMLTRAENFNLLNYHHIFVIFIEDSVVSNALDVLPVSVSKGHDNLSESSGGAEETRLIRIFTDTVEDGSNSVQYLKEPVTALLERLLDSHSQPAGYVYCRTPRRAPTRVNV